MLIGVAAGLLSGAFGVGGGIIIVPLLVAFAGLDQKRAAATSLLAILPTAVAGSVTYIAHGEVDYAAAALIAVGAIVGAIIGTALLRRIPVTALRWIFVAMLLVVAVRMFLEEPLRSDPRPLTLALALGYVLLGLVMGVASGLLGVGGGVIAVPALVAVFGVSDLVAKGTSLLVMIPTTLSGTLRNRSNGLVQVRTAVIVGLSAAVASVGGAYIALAVPPRVGTIAFGAFVLVIAVHLAVQALRAGRPRAS